jgi:hypothetical protein
MNQESVEATRIIKKLLTVLPNSLHPEDPSWKWCWNELSNTGQDAVILAAVEAYNWLKDNP